ncbi:hypothetical protein Scep_008071 [Stephania cephalantha]|uniref:DYW domain-containing protein n=1 Tax=Stephania cephalantha TaxID=152367 RepID=A0AAP0KCZ2_9MAGN
MTRKQKLRQAVDSLYSLGKAAEPSTYTSLLLECVGADDAVEAKRLQSHMDLHSFQPKDAFLHNRLLHLFAKTGRLSDAHQLFDKMPHRDVFSWNAMLSAHAKAGNVARLREVFDGMVVRDSVSYNTAISGFVGSGCCGEALEVLGRMRRGGMRPTEYTYVGVLNACSQLLDLRRGREIHGQIVVGLIGNVFVWNALIDLYAKCGDVDRARWVFDRMVGINVVSWNSMISGYLRNGRLDECLDLFHQMQAFGVEPDLVTMSSVLGAYFQMGLVEEATRIFRGMKERDGVCWTTMIVGYSQNKREENALLLFQEMLSENIRPDNYTISCLVSVCARLAVSDHGKVVHCKAIQIGIEDDLPVSTALVDMYSKLGEITDAWTLFKTMPVRNVISWNAMIIGYAQNGRDEDALALYERMLEENFKPDNITFVGVLSACGHLGLVDEGRSYFSSISEQHGLRPTLDHYACMMNLYGRSGHMKEVMDMLKAMPDKPNQLIWSTLLSVSRINKEIDHAEVAAKHLFELDSQNAEPYIMLSNMYAAAGRWTDVASMRSLMKDRNIQKSAAYSWIQVDNEVYKFVSDDRTHPQSEEIYRELNRLIKRMQEAGFTSDSMLALHDVGEEEKVKSVCYHSEKLALAFALNRKPESAMPIRILKNIRVCADCHRFMKFVSKVMQRHIVLRDSSLFHHFRDGQCSCNDFW